MRKNLIILQNLILNRSVPLLGLILIVALASFTLPWADDFCNLEMMGKFNPFTYAWRFYNEWDGRIFTFFVQGIFLQNTSLGKISIYVWLLFFFLCTRFVLKITLRQENKINLWMFFMLSVVFWLGFRRHISETVYWSTGGGYMLASLIGLLWIYLYEKFEQRNSAQVVAWALFSLIAGVNSFSLAPALLTYIAYPKIRDLIRLKSLGPVKDKKFLISLLMVLLGAIIISIAPGNFARATKANDAFEGFILTNLISVNFKFLIFGWPLIPLSAVFAYIFRDHIIDSDKDKKIQWLLTALSTAAPLAILNGFSAPRTAIFFHFFITIFFIFSFKSVFEKFTLKNNVRIGLKLAITLVFFAQILTDMKNGYHFYIEYSNQLNTLESQRDSKESITLERNIKPPRSLRISDFSENPDHWSNKCAASLYGLDSIIMKDRIQKP